LPQFTISLNCEAEANSKGKEGRNS